ncbi:hypothetical protein CY35_09G031000 [Sphagnum magellanicum]|nr:hypothetical protein CY35_09G031000 [Sphagnum magellanicum]
MNTLDRFFLVFSLILKWVVRLFSLLYITILAILFRLLFHPLFCVSFGLSDLNLQIDVVWTSSLLRGKKQNLVNHHSTKFRGHGVKALEFCSLLSFSVLILVGTDPFFGVADAASILLKPRLLRPQPDFSMK